MKTQKVRATEGGSNLSRRERKKRETRRRLYESAVTLFKERGFEGTRIQDITERADVAVGTFFNYFPSKEAVLQGGQRESLEESLAHARSLTGGSARERFEAQFRWLARRAERSDNRIVRIFFRHVMTNPSLTRPNRPLVYQLFDCYEAWIDHGKATGEIRSDVDSRTAALTLHELWSHTSLRWAGNPDEIELEERVLARVDLVFRGLG